MDLQFKTFPFEIKGGAADGSTFEGLVSVFHNIDSYGEIVDDGAFDQDLPEFMQDGFIGGLNHDWDNPIGKPQMGTKKVKEGLHLVGSVIDTSHGMDVRKMLKAGVVKKLSIGYKKMGDMMLEDEDACMRYWETKGYKPNAQDMARCKGGARVLTRVKLYEGSPVTVAANDLAYITAVKAAREAAESVLKTPEPIEPAGPAEADRLTKIREIKARADAEEILRNAGFSSTEAKALFSSVKSLLRNVASDDAGTDAKAGEDALLDAPEQPEPPGPIADASETLPEAKDAETVEAPNVTTSDNEQKGEPTNLQSELVRSSKERVADLLSRRALELDAQISAALARHARAS